MAKKKEKAVKGEEPLKLFYIFYNQERWDNWITTLKESDFTVKDGSEEMPDGYTTLYNFSMDITIEVLKIIRLFQNGRFTKDEALQKLNQVESIVMADITDETIEEYVESLQLSMLVLFAGCKRFLEGGYSTDIKTLVKDGKKAGDEDLETALGIAAEIGANVINGAACCSKYIKDDIEQPGLFDEWLIEIESMHEAMGSLKNFDEEAGEAS
ncbi:MAG TPA: DUF2150 family protein [Methanoregulaceae archaeon]|nr:DUF2150 family protein [Methanoregulaceae archaeon]HPM61987.1 DUF2150 family protein [Methanoregulaceae archaeon]